MKKLLLIPVLAAALSAADDASLAEEVERLKKALQTLQNEQESYNETLLEELSSLKETIETPELAKDTRVSGLGISASKVYRSREKLSIGGYGEMYLRKMTAGSANYDAPHLADNYESNILRFIPYIGYKFNDWIIMNTELEWENGGANPHKDEGYNYAIVEFTYIDFLLDPAYNLRVGHLLVPMGNINLNHEPTQFLTTDRPTVEKLIIPSTWHTNGTLVYGDIGSWHYQAGFVTAPDVAGFEQGTFIKGGRGGGKQNTDDLGAVARFDYQGIPGLNIGVSAFYATSGSRVENAEEHTMTLWDLHVDYRAGRLELRGVVTAGSLDGNDLSYMSAADRDTTYFNSRVASGVFGAYVTAGYDIMPVLSSGSANRLMAFVQYETLDMDANDDAVFDAGTATASQADDQAWNEYVVGLDYFPDPNFVIKGDLKTVDYQSASLLKDEQFATLSLGYIF
jgi:hypothetical protein